MNLQKEISLGGSKKVDYPVKTEINLMKAEVTRGNVIANILLFLVFLVLLAIFVKFAVVDPLSMGMQSSAKLESARAELKALEAENESYAELNQAYMKYVVTGLTEDEMNLADRNTLIDLLTETVINAVPVSSVKVVGNSVVVTCVGVGLQDISTLVQQLEQHESVAYVTVSTAQDKDSTASSATIQIELTGALAADKQEGANQSDQAGSASGNNASSGGGSTTSAESSTTPGEDLAGALGVPTSGKGGSNEN